MKNTNKSFKTTLLLYIVILLLPFAFYFVNSSFKEIQSDTKVIQQIGWIDGAISRLALNLSEENNQKTIKKIDKTLKEIGVWVKKNQNSQFYIGTNSLLKDFFTIQSRWESFQTNSNNVGIATVKNNIYSHWKLIGNFSITLEKMVYLKQNQIINMFYLTLIVVMILMLLSIYFIRSYIDVQIGKESIYDMESKLYNQKYLFAELTSTCARASRYEYPLSLVSIAIENLDTNKYKTKDRKHILEIIGGVITATIRTSDVACRYDNNHIVIMLPFTELESSFILEERIKTLFETQDFMVNKRPSFKFSTIQFNGEESSTECLQRAEEKLESRRAVSV